MRVISAMSGGVDSSVATARMIDLGHEVVGVHLALSRTDSNGKSRGCCTLDDARDARRVADKLGIPFYVWDFSSQFAESVMKNFLDEYSAGRTPNPCLRCNEKIKFSAVLDRALALGFDAVATGHYAQIKSGPHGIEMHRAVDPLKDQSYVLGVLTQKQLEHSFFPLGGDHKPAIRAEAEERGLITAKKPDSHDICFIPDGDTAGFLVNKLGGNPGAIREISTGEIVGEHSGTFTVTNTGSRGALFDTPIVNQPQVAILGTGAVVKRPIVVTDDGGQDVIAIRSMVYLALSYDHRLVDGADAARFLNTMKSRLEEAAFDAELGL